MLRTMLFRSVLLLFPLMTVVGCASTSGSGTTPPVEKNTPNHEQIRPGHFHSIFNGRTLENWEGDETYWSVTDGVIVGSTTRDTLPKKDQFLIWTGARPADFELKLEFRIHNHNGGVQFRSERNPGYGPSVSGYQADIDRAGSWLGACFEEGGKGLIAKRGNRVKVTRFGMVKHLANVGPPEKTFLSDFNANGWNTYRILAKGNRISYYINGHRITEVIDERENAPRKGLIALQLKGGEPMKIGFRNIRLKIIKQRSGKSKTDN